MRRPRAALGSAAWLLAGLLLVAAPARAAEAGVEIALRAGYVWGHGWTVGPALGVIAARSQPVPSREGFLLVGGVGLATDVLVPRAGAGNVGFRVHVGPQVMAMYACPTVGPKLTVGATWLFRSGARPQVGFEGGVSFLAMYTQRTTFNAIVSDPWFVSLGYRFMEYLEGERTHELELANTIWAWLAPDARINGGSFCNTFGHVPSGPN